jgi:hypothetical protein
VSSFFKAANIGAPISPLEMERMAKRRFQNPGLNVAGLVAR